MVDIGYAKLFNSLSSLFNRSRTSFFDKKYIKSMAVLGWLEDLDKGVPNPYYQEKKEVGQIEIPDDIFSLSSVPNIKVQVWYYGDASSLNVNRDYSFALSILGYIEVPKIDILYGVVSKVQEVTVFGWHRVKDKLHPDKYICKPPVGFSVASFANILNNGSLTKFVLEYGSLSDVQRNIIIKYGIC